MIFNMISGIKGDADLNFSVVKYDSPAALPETENENTIAVFTNTEITDWVFSPTEPEAPAVGASPVWFVTGAVSDMPFNALKTGCLMVYLMYAKQYIDGNWVNVEAMIYKDGRWLDIVTETVMFANGAFDTDTFGKLKAMDNVNVAGIYNGYFCIRRYTSSQTTVAFDVTKFNKIEIDVHANSYMNLAVYLVYDGYTRLISTGASWSAGETTVLDISEYDGECYIKFYGTTNNDANYMYISDIRFKV